MDLFAYAQIGDLEKIAKTNGIEVPRLRGYRLMSDETPVSEAEIKKIIQDCGVDVCKELCTAEPFWKINADWWSCNPRTNALCDYYLAKGADGEYESIRWDRIHGWKRKVLKFALKKQKQKIQRQYGMWNKYVGRKDVLYIHARIGGGNWNCFGGNELMKQPWFLDKVDDWVDGTYCDIYASIKEEEGK